MKKGIDVSEHQRTIDWKKVKSQIDFVILREGCRQRADNYFFKNVKGCKDNQIPIKGVYHFMYALNNQEALKEAESCLSNIEKAGLTKDVIVWADFEYDTVDDAKEDHGVILGAAECNLFTATFCEFFKQRGYRTGIYTNLDYYKNMYKQSLLDKYPIWLANPGGKATKPCLYFQYSWKGKVDGIITDDRHGIDMDYWYDEQEEEGTTLMSTKEKIQKVIDIASAELGYLEKRSNSYLDSKTANAGSANYTKYWRDIKPSYQAQPWCAAFVSWCMMKAFGQANAQKLLKHWPYVYCPTMSGLFTMRTKPQAGDIVIFNHSGVFTHTGLVVSTTSSTFTTIEGNTSGASGIIANGGGVCKKTYSIASYVNNGTRFCRPDYAAITVAAEGAATATPQQASITDSLADLKKGSKGNAVKVMQKMLIACGYSCGSSGADGEFGTATDKALRKFQADYKNQLIADGIYGAGSRAVLSDLYSKKITEVAKAVLQGKYGNANERKRKLAAAGFEYADVQKRVNELLK